MPPRKYLAASAFMDVILCVLIQAGGFSFWGNSISNELNVHRDINMQSNDSSTQLPNNET